MTAEEIRALRPTSAPLSSGDYLKYEAMGMFLREIAAQVAEQTAIAREALEMRKADDVNMKAYREQSLRTASEMKDVIAAPQQTIPVIRIPPPGEQPEHLGCFLLLPDGTYGVGIVGENGPGIVPLEMEEAQRLIAVLSKPPEGKPS